MFQPAEQVKLNVIPPDAPQHLTPSKLKRWLQRRGRKAEADSLLIVKHKATRVGPQPKRTKKDIVKAD